MYITSKSMMTKMATQEESQNQRKKCSFDKQQQKQQQIQSGFYPHLK